MKTANIEVVEGNDDEAWAQWEDSVAFHESQFPVECELDQLTSDFQALQQPDEVDPFESVTKKSA